MCVGREEDGMKEDVCVCMCVCGEEGGGGWEERGCVWGGRRTG